MTTPGRNKAAMSACLALLDAFDPDHSAAGRRKLLISALEAAMSATGHESKDSPGAASAMLDHLEREIRSRE